MSGAIAATAPVVRGVRMLVAPVDRVTRHALIFDPAVQGRFAAGSVPTGWYDVGPVSDLHRDAETSFAEVWSGAPAVLKTRARAKVSAGLQCTFASWSKLALGLSSGSQQMNLLRLAAIAGHAYSGGSAEPAMALLPGSTASVLQLPAGSNVAAGDLIVVDDDYAATVGYVGAGIVGSYVPSPEAVGYDVHYTRRVSWNVARVASVTASSSATTVTLAAPLLAGVPTATMKLGVLTGFVDRLGGSSFVSEWSALLVMDGVQGDRVLLHYPRLQIAPGAAEVVDDLAAGLQRWRLRAAFHALPMTDTNDGAAVLCFRSYLPAPMRTV